MNKLSTKQGYSRAKQLVAPRGDFGEKIAESEFPCSLIIVEEKHLLTRPDVSAGLFSDCSPVPLWRDTRRKTYVERPGRQHEAMGKL